MKKLILVYDPDLAITNSIAHILTHEGYSVHSVTTKNDLIYCLGTFKPGLILYDMHSPNDFYGEKIELKFKTHVILMSGWSVNSGHKTLKKPFTIEELLDTMDRYTSDR